VVGKGEEKRLTLKVEGLEEDDVVVEWDIHVGLYQDTETAARAFDRMPRGRFPNRPYALGGIRIELPKLGLKRENERFCWGDRTMAVGTERLPTPPLKMTLEEFRALPEGPPDYEFEKGEVIPLPRPHGQHQDILAELLGALRSHVKRHRLGRVWPEIDVELPNERSYVPDLCYLSRERQGAYSEEDGKIHGAPDLVVEIVSRSSASRDRLRKMTGYFEAGVPWYWLVDSHDLGIEEYRATPQGYLRTASVEAGDTFRPGLFPGLEINLQALLEEGREDLEDRPAEEAGDA
jgi:Uma2 family endonuclease